MKPLIWKIFVIFVIVNLAVGQAMPVLAQENTPETPAPEGEITESPTPTEIEIEETSTITPTSETVTPTATEIPLTPMEIAPVIEIQIRATPETIKADRKITLYWEVFGISEPDPTLTLQLSLPKGFAPKEVKEEKFDSQNGLIYISLLQLNGTVQVEAVDEIIEDAVFLIRLYDENQVLLDMNQVIVPLREKFDVDKNGEEITARDGELRVKFSSNALKNEDIEVEIGNPAGNGLPYSLSGKPFEIKAITKKDGQPLTQFDERVEFTINLNTYGFENKKNGDLFLYWYNPETSEWQGLSSWIDEETNTLHGSTEHFSIFDIGPNSFEATKTPHMKGFQVSNYTGSATYSFPIEVPPGAGGLQPNLSLDYNSQIVDQATTNSQPGWVGMGWSLNTGSILLNTKNNTDTVDDSWVISINGINTEAYYAFGNYFTTSEYFIKITRAGNVWTIWDKNGNIYYFEHVLSITSQNGMYPAYTPYRWSLTKVVNKFGQQLTYTYTNETKILTFYYMGYSGQFPTDTAVYPDTITYPDGRTRVRFVLEDRNDYAAADLSDDLHHSFERKRLDKIYIERDVDGNGSFETIMKAYNLTYSAGSINQIWPNIIKTAGGKISTLISVQEYGLGGDVVSSPSSLPPTTFTYVDSMHLTEAQNGYGGTVKFEYQIWYYTANARPSYKASLSYPSGYPIASGMTSMGLIAGYSNIASAPKPGSAYYAYASTSVPSKVRLYNGSTYQDAVDTTAPYQPSGVFVLPATASQLSGYVENLSSSTALGYSVELWALTTIYRVSKKTILDGQGHTYESTFAYTGAAVNDPATSAAAASNTDHTEIYSEFRGHATVTETTPDGTTITSSYFKDDIYRGRQSNQTVKYAGVKISETLTTYAHNVLQSYNYNSKIYQDIWVKTMSAENRTYALNGTSYSATRSLFDYELSYGNLTTTTEQSWNGSAWSTYRSSTNYYWFNNSATKYLVGLPGKMKVFDAAGNTLSTTIYLYDGNTGDHQTMPTNGKLTAVRTYIDSTLGTLSWQQTSFGYDTWGNQTTQTTWTGYAAWNANPSTGTQTTTTQYDSVYHAYPVKITNTLGQFIEMGYDYTKGVPTSLKDLNGNITTAGYDAFGRITSLTRVGDASPTLSMSYVDSYPFTTTITLNAVNYQVTKKYDGMGRQTQVISGGVISDTVYQSATVTKQSVPYTGTSPNQFTTSTYYPALRKTEVQAPDLTITSTVVNGLTTTVTDAKGYVTTSTSDVWGRVKLVTPPTGPTVEYFYTQQNLLWKVVRGGAETIMTYDNAGRKKSMSDPDMGSWAYTYDALGNLKTQSDARGCLLTMLYDPLNRLTNKTSSGSGCGTQVSTSYAYDQNANGIGHRTSMTDASGSTAWMYDARGRMTKETKVISGQSFVTEYGYNSADLLDWMKYPGTDAEIVNYDYNDRMLLESVWNMSGIYASSILYDSAGRMTNLTRGDDVLATAYSYYPWTQQGGRLDTLTTTRTSDQIELQELDYTYDNAGNINTITDLLSGEIQTFGYDTLHRLTSAVVTNGLANYNESYGYNSTTGNLETKGGNTLTYGDTSHKHAVTSAGGNNYAYDANGNMITRDINSGALSGDYILSYDAENRLVEVKKNNVVMATFVYDGDGKQVKATVNGIETLYVGSHYEIKDSIVTKYYFAGTTRLAFRENGTLNFLLSDHLGSSSITTDADGVTTAEMLYKAWGETRLGSLDTKYQFTGQRNEGEIGLHFYNARWYDSSLGRFAQADTMIPSQQGVQAWDRYAYTNNNPLIYTDPTGHEICDADGYCGYDPINNRLQNGGNPNRGNDDEEDGNGGGGGNHGNGGGNEGGCHGALCSPVTENNECTNWWEYCVTDISPDLMEDYRDQNKKIIGTSNGIGNTLLVLTTADFVLAVLVYFGVIALAPEPITKTLLTIGGALLLADIATGVVSNDLSNVNEMIVETEADDFGGSITTTPWSVTVHSNSGNFDTTYTIIPIPQISLGLFANSGSAP